MHRAIALTASLALLLAVAAPTSAATHGPSYTWRYAELYYVSETGAAVYAPGLHSRLTVRFSTSESRDGATTFVQVISSGWLTNEWGGMEYDWYEAYEQVVPLDPSLGGVDKALRSAWVDAGPITLACYSSHCPDLPQTITVSGTWTSTGPVAATTEKVVDDLGWSSMLMRRERAASADINIAPDFPVPPILVRSIIATQTQVAMP
jgi:hypothetical protein